MTTEVLSPVLKQQFFGNDGKPLVGGKLFSYIAGSSTKQATYSDSIGTPNSNPTILDFRGEANVWIPPNVGYKFVLAPKTDTDPPTSPIWTVDQIVSSQLVTLYGGVDIGVINAYVLNFTSNFTAYQDGIVIYWIPANTNSTASTVNVNSLGVVNIINQDGTALRANQIIANQITQIMYKSGSFLLISSGISASITSGSFVPSWLGFSVPPTGPMFWQTAGRAVTLFVGAQGLGTSNANSMSIGNLPANLRPSTGGSGSLVCTMVDNGVASVGTLEFLGLSSIQFNKGTSPPSATGFTAAGTKGLDFGWTVTYYNDR